jgi:hypothetical protein
MSHDSQDRGITKFCGVFYTFPVPFPYPLWQERNGPRDTLMTVAKGPGRRYRPEPWHFLRNAMYRYIDLRRRSSVRCNALRCPALPCDRYDATVQLLRV